jgi:tellurite resistance protein TehA-like permease
MSLFARLMELGISVFLLGVGFYLIKIFNALAYVTWTYIGQPPQSVTALGSSFSAYAPYATAAIVAAGVTGVIHAVVSMVRGED